MNFHHIASVLNLGEIIREPVRVNGGLLHKMYRITTSGGEFAVKVLNPEIMKRPEALANMIRSERIARSFAEVIPLISAMERDGNAVLYSEGEYVLVFPWLEGSKISGAEITPSHCKVIGKTLGKIHQKNIQIEGVTAEEDAFPMFAWDDLTERIHHRTDREHEWITAYENALDDITEWNKKACESEPYLLERQVISHRDLDAKNVMWQGAQAYVIDWESAGYVNPFQELLEVINAWADDGNGMTDREKCKALMQEYSRYNEIGSADWAAVFCGSYIGMLGWLAYNMKRALGLETSDEEEAALGEEQVAMTIRELYCWQDKLSRMKEWLCSK